MTTSVLVAKAESLAIFRSTKGKIVCGLFWLWVTLPSFIYAASHVDMDDVARRAQALTLIHAFSLQAALHLLACPLGEQFATLSIFSLLPLFTLALSFDRGGTLPGRRDTAGESNSALAGIAFLAGKRAGVWLVFCAVAAAIYLPIALAEFARDQYGFWFAIRWAAQLWACSCVVAAVYLSYWGAFATWLRSKWVAFAASASFGLLLLATRGLAQAKVPAVAALFPGSLDALLLAGAARPVLSAMLIAFGWCVASLLISFLILRSRESRSSGLGVMQLS